MAPINRVLTFVGAVNATFKDGMPLQPELLLTMFAANCAYLPVAA
jgi:hypothetical protein